MAPSAALLLATTLPLLAILFPAASACSPPIAGLSPTTSTSTPLVVSVTTTRISTADDASASPSPSVVARLAAGAPSPPAGSACAASAPHATARDAAPVWTPASAPTSPRTRSAATRHPPSPTASSPPPATARDAAPVRSSATPTAWAPSSPRTPSGSSSGIAMVGSAATSTIDAEAHRARSEAVESPRRGCSAYASPGCSTTSTLDAGAPRARSAESTRASASPGSATATPASAPSSPRTRSGSSSGIAMMAGSAATPTIDAEAHRPRSEAVESTRRGCYTSASPGCPTTSTLDAGASPGTATATPASPSPPVVLSDTACASATVRDDAASATPTSVANSATCESVSSSTNATVGSAITVTFPTSTSSSSSSPGRMILILSLVAAILVAAGGLAVRGSGSDEAENYENCCRICFDKPVFLLECCNRRLCNFCLRDYIRDRHHETCTGMAPGKIVPLLHPHLFEIGHDAPEEYAHLPQYPPWYFATSVKKNGRLHLFYYNLHELEAGADPRVTEVIHHANAGRRLSAAVRHDIHPRMRPFSEL